jgi:hypothetical protein
MATIRPLLEAQHDFFLLQATLAPRLQAENQEALATKERKDHKRSREQASSMRSLRSFAANVLAGFGRDA